MSNLRFQLPLGEQKLTAHGLRHPTTATRESDGS